MSVLLEKARLKSEKMKAVCFKTGTRGFTVLTQRAGNKSHDNCFSTSLKLICNFGLVWVGLEKDERGRERGGKRERGWERGR